jgi:hypothetical protein
VKVATIGVAYLARKAEGLNALQRFADSYRRHPAGIQHRLIVIYKGFDQRVDLDAARRVFHDLPHVDIELSDVGFDIGAYVESSRRVSDDYLAFLNTHSEIVAPDWLAKLFEHASRNKVGIAGTMGSYESIQETVLLLKNVIWQCVGVGQHYDARVAYYYDFVLKQHHPAWYTSTGTVVPPATRGRTKLQRTFSTALRIARYPRFVRGGTRLIWPGASSFNIRLFPPFPNPHIRSNGFMLRREQLLALHPSTTPRKVDASLFESGVDSLTAKVRRRGYSAVVVGRDSHGYEVAEWHKSGTFRLGDQRNLLIADNHTRAFEAMSAGARLTHARMTWGSYIGPPPRDFPDLGFKFEQGRLEPL